MIILLNESTCVSDCWLVDGDRAAAVHQGMRGRDSRISGSGTHVDDGLLPHRRPDGLMSVRNCEAECDNRSNEDADVEYGGIRGGQPSGCQTWAWWELYC